MTGRQAVLLSLLASANRSAEKLQLVKWAFFLQEEHPELPGTHRFEFVPYQYGPFSFALYHDLKKLEEAGLVRMEEKHVEITPRGKDIAQNAPISGARQVIDKYGEWSSNRLRDYVYETREWFRLNSIVGGVDKPARPVAPNAVYTVGYEGLSLDALLDKLLKRGIQCLIDVRENPVARRYGFHKSTLANATDKVGLGYVHIPEVGVPSEWRQELDSAGAYSSLFERYRTEVLPLQIRHVSRIAKLVKEQPSALMCKEADPACCHRTSLAMKVREVTGLEVIDLGDRELALF